MKKIAGILLAALMSPLAQAETIVGLRDGSFDLVSFDSANPSVLTGRLALRGIASGFYPVALDMRPSTGALYLLTVSFSANPPCRLYVVNAGTGAVSPVGAAFACTNMPVDMDFSPVSAGEHLRVITEAENYRLNPDTGARTADPDVAFAGADVRAGDDPRIIGLAYDNNVSGAASSTLYAIHSDSANSALVRVGGVNGSPSPSNGELTSIGPLGVATDLSGAPFDIAGAAPHTAYFYRYLLASGSSLLYRVNLATGEATALGAVGRSGAAFLGITVAPGIALPTIEEEPAVAAGGALGGWGLALLASLAVWRRWGRVRRCQG